MFQQNHNNIGTDGVGPPSSNNPPRLSRPQYNNTNNVPPPINTTPAPIMRQGRFLSSPSPNNNTPMSSTRSGQYTPSPMMSSRGGGGGGHFYYPQHPQQQQQYYEGPPQTPTSQVRFEDPSSGKFFYFNIKR